MIKRSERIAPIQKLLAGKDQVIDFTQIEKKYPWIFEQDRQCILSPDSDGLLCGLIMSHLLNWKIVGFYDGKVLLLKKGISSKDCIFLDMEIYRNGIRSCGQHMLMFNNNNVPLNWANFAQCLQPNNLRQYDGLHSFRLKYPLATIHFIISILSSKIKFELPASAACALLFTDGTYNVLFGYPENVLNWLHYLRVDTKQNPLNSIFHNNNATFFEIMKDMDEFFRKRDQISIKNERGDRLRISTRDGTPTNLVKNKDDTYSLAENALKRIQKFISLLAEHTSWTYKPSNWTWDGYQAYQFTKKDFTGRRLNSKTFKELVEQNPLSWAMTSGQNIEYTLETPDKLP